MNLSTLWREPVPSNEQRRQAAKRKLERQIARRAERAKRRRLIAVTATVVAVVVVVGGIYLIATSGNSSSQAASPSSTPKAKTSNGPCKYTSTPDTPAPSGKDVGLPQDPSPTPKTGTVQVTLKTNQGDIPVTLDRTEAACTVQSEVHLVTSKFYDNTPCHRLTGYTSPPLKVLQCGDPTGQGSGGPGYGIPDEKPKNLKAAPAVNGQGGSVIYPAGTLAMANSGQPNSGGSQFFLVYGDSYLPANYTVFGTIAPSGLTVLNKIAAGGIIPGQDPQSGAPTPTDGKPKVGVTITQATTDQKS
jgi:peptidyl-prolyl cis-trans isomerase B (cyclophilin B)